MKDIVGIIVIIFYWLFLALILSSISTDESLAYVSASYEGNSSTVIDVDTSNINVTDIEVSNTAGSVSFISMLGRILTFRIPVNSSFPAVVVSIINISNFILIAVFGILLYRQIRSGSG